MSGLPLWVKARWRSLGPERHCEHATVERDDLGVVEQDHPGVAAMALDLVQDLRPHTPDARQIDAGRGRRAAGLPIADARRGSSRRRRRAHRRTQASAPRAATLRTPRPRTAMATPRSLSPGVAAASVSRTAAWRRCRLLGGEAGVTVPDAGVGEEPGTLAIASRRSIRSSRAATPRSVSSAPGSRTRAHISSSCEPRRRRSRASRSDPR